MNYLTCDPSPDVKPTLHFLSHTLGSLLSFSHSLSHHDSRPIRHITLTLTSLSPLAPSHPHLPLILMSSSPPSHPYFPLIIVPSSQSPNPIPAHNHTPNHDRHHPPTHPYSPFPNPPHPPSLRAPTLHQPHTPRQRPHPHAPHLRHARQTPGKRLGEHHGHLFRHPAH